MSLPVGFLEIFLFSRETLHNFSTNPIYVSKWQGEQTVLDFTELEDGKISTRSGHLNKGLGVWVVFKRRVVLLALFIFSLAGRF